MTFQPTTQCGIFFLMRYRLFWEKNKFFFSYNLLILKHHKVVHVLTSYNC